MVMEKCLCKFHMNITWKKPSDTFFNDSLQLVREPFEEGTLVKSNPEKYSGIYKELAEILGDTATFKIWKRFSGLNITFPQKLYSKEFREDFIRENMEEMKPSEMARALGLSERRIRQIIAEIKN